MSRKYLMSTEPACSCAEPAAFARFGAKGGFRLHRHHQHDIVVDHRLDFPPAKPEPPRDFESLLVMAAAEEPHLAELLDRGPQRHSHKHVLTVASFDFLMRHFDEIGALEHGREGFNQLA
jgi:hypothetical protein